MCPVSLMIVGFCAQHTLSFSSVVQRKLLLPTHRDRSIVFENAFRSVVRLPLLQWGKILYVEFIYWSMTLNTPWNYVNIKIPLWHREKENFCKRLIPHCSLCLKHWQTLLLITHFIYSQIYFVLQLARQSRKLLSHFNSAQLNALSFHKGN